MDSCTILKKLILKRFLKNVWFPEKRIILAINEGRKE